MPETVFRGPVAGLGALLDSTISPFDGPGLNYQGTVLPDPRFSPANKDSLSNSTIPGFLIGNSVVTVDQIPSPLSTTTVAAAQVATSGTAMTLATACLGGAAAGAPCWTPQVPIIPVGTSVATTAYAIDFGFATGTTTANSSTVVVVDNTAFRQGQWLVIGGAGDTNNRTCLIAQVASISTSNLTGITIAPVAVGALNNAPIGQGNLHGGALLPPATQFGPAAASASAAQPYRAAGFALAFDPVQAMTRALSVTAGSVTGGTATILVSGFDIYGNAMTELLTASGTTTVAGKKAFKYVSNVIPSTSGTLTNYTIGIADVVGLPLRCDRFGSIEVTLGTGKMATSAGFTSALATTSNATTADVRGALVLNTVGGAIMTSNGTGRLTVVQTIPLLAMINASPQASTSLFGAAQA